MDMPYITIGILGSGQLGRMLAMAAAQLGIKTHIFAPDAKTVQLAKWRPLLPQPPTMITPRLISLPPALT